jgi:hypothetical protein
MAMATTLSGLNGRVWEVAGVLARAFARGESERWSAAMGRGDALARSGACPCTLWRHWTSWACTGQGVARFSLANGGVHRVQQRERGGSRTW